MVNPEDPRVLRTRQLIKEAFRALLLKKGFDAITVKDIAQSATINRATFYAHFEDKYALLDEITEQAFHGMIPEEVANAQTFTDEICNQLIVMTHRYIMEFYRVCRMDSNSMATLVDEKIKKLLQQTIECIFLRGHTSLGADKHQLKMMAAMTGSAIYGAAYYWLNAGEGGPTDRLAALVRPYVMNGLGLDRNSDALLPHK